MLVQADAAGLEWRTILELSRDPVGIAEVLSGEDTHAKNQSAFGLPSRLIAKIFLFRTIFRGSGWSFAHDPNFSHVSSDPKFWNKKNEEFYEKYKGIDICHKRWAQAVVSAKAIIGPTGREWFIDISNYDGEIPWTVVSNYPVQGTGADIVMVARISLSNRMAKMGLRSILVSTVHDSIVADCPNAEVPIVVKLMHDVFNDIPKNFLQLFGHKLVLPFPCETKIGKNLLEMEKILPQTTENVV